MPQHALVSTSKGIARLARWTRAAGSVLASLVLVGILVSLVGAAQAAPPSTAITYAYDELGRLVAVSDPSQGAAKYTYDGVGNLSAIARQTVSVVSILGFSPKAGPAGTTVTIYGTGFSATPSQNTVKFNGTVGTVVSSQATKIVATVPSGATTGRSASRRPAARGRPRDPSPSVPQARRSRASRRASRRSEGLSRSPAPGSTRRRSTTWSPRARRALRSRPRARRA
jgi:YD repeat-containing protein